MTDHRPVAVVLENRLMGHGIYVTDCERRPAAEAASADDTDGTSNGDAADPERDATPPDGTGLALEYETVSEATAVGSGEVGTVVRTVLDVADERDWVPGRLEATSLTTDGSVRGRWHVRREWFDGLGIELDDLEFSQRVLGTRRPEPGEK